MSLAFHERGRQKRREEKFRNSLSQDRWQGRERGRTRRYGSKTIEKARFCRLEISSENNQLHSGQRKIRFDVCNAHDAHRQLFPLSYTKFTIRYYRTPIVGKACTIYIYIPARRKFIEFIGPRKFIDPDKSLSAK